MLASVLVSEIRVNRQLSGMQSAKRVSVFVREFN